MERNFFNVILLGFGFMFLFTAFQTMGNIEVSKAHSNWQSLPTSVRFVRVEMLLLNCENDEHIYEIISMKSHFFIELITPCKR